jgi:hypothetical protein
MFRINTEDVEKSPLPTFASNNNGPHNPFLRQNELKTDFGEFRGF